MKEKIAMMRPSLNNSENLVRTFESNCSKYAESVKAVKDICPLSSFSYMDTVNSGRVIFRNDDHILDVNLAPTTVILKESKFDTLLQFNISYNVATEQHIVSGAFGGTNYTFTWSEEKGLVVSDGVNEVLRIYQNDMDELIPYGEVTLRNRLVVVKDYLNGFSRNRQLFDMVYGK